MWPVLCPHSTPGSTSVVSGVQSMTQRISSHITSSQSILWQCLIQNMLKVHVIVKYPQKLWRQLLPFFFFLQSKIFYWTMTIKLKKCRKILFNCSCLDKLCWNWPLDLILSRKFSLKLHLIKFEVSGCSSDTLPSTIVNHKLSDKLRLDHWDSYLEDNINNCEYGGWGRCLTDCRDVSTWLAIVNPH